MQESVENTKKDGAASGPSPSEQLQYGGSGEGAASAYERLRAQRERQARHRPGEDRPPAARGERTA
jgi:hypothetical protein